MLSTVRQLVAVSVAIACASALWSSPAVARSRHHLRPAPLPSPDAVELGLLAPPSPRSTFVQSYGDAAIARSQVSDRPAGGPAPYPCDPRVASGQGYECRNLPGQLGYGQFYAFTPSAVSAPQDFGVPDASVESPLLSPVTSLFYAVNSARIYAHD